MEPQIAAELRQASGVCLIAEEEQSKIAMGWCCVRMIPPESELFKITLRAQFRRKGVGNLLLNESIMHCIQSGCNQMFLEVRQKNRQALKFYQRLGFREHSVRKDYYSTPLDDGIILKKDLNTASHSNKGDPTT